MGSQRLDWENNYNFLSSQIPMGAKTGTGVHARGFHPENPGQARVVEEKSAFCWLPVAAIG